MDPHSLQDVEAPRNVHNMFSFGLDSFLLIEGSVLRDFGVNFDNNYKGPRLSSRGEGAMGM